MPLSMALLRSESLAHAGIDALDLDPSGGSAILDLTINRAWWDIISQFDFKEEEKITTFDTVLNQIPYLIQTIIGSDIFDAVRQLSIVDPNTNQSTVLNEISIRDYQDRYNSQTSLQARPDSYFHDGGSLYLYPTPDGVYTITVYYKYILNDLTAGNPAIPQDWHESILYGTVERLHTRSRDYISASIIESKQTREIMKRMTTDAKEDKYSKTAGISVMRNPYNVRH